MHHSCPYHTSVSTQQNNQYTAVRHNIQTCLQGSPGLPGGNGVNGHNELTGRDGRGGAKGDKGVVGPPES